MCGIAGLITKNNIQLSAKHYQKRNKIFTGLLVAMQERGEQSAGVAFVDKNKLAIVKSPTSAVKFIKNNRFKKELNKNYPMIIGHTRYATMGEINKTNAHPFLRGSIVGVHNGTISNVNDFKRFNHIQVDSELIFELLNENNNNFIKAFKKIEGNFAIAWTKMETDDYSLYLVKSGNPLYIAYIKELKTYFYCSTEEALNTVILSHYNNVKVNMIAYEKATHIKSDLTIELTTVDFKHEPYNSGHSSYYTNDKWDKKEDTKNSKKKESKKKRHNGWSWEEDINGICGQCHLSLEFCQCDVYEEFVCSNCNDEITSKYYPLTDNYNLCEGCYEFWEIKKWKGIKGINE